MSGRERWHNESDERGAALLAALCLAMVFAICLSSYLALCYASLKLSTRNQMSMRSIEIAEMGLEQGLYSLNANNRAGDWTGGWAPQGSGEAITMAVTSSGLASTAGNPVPMNLGNGVTGKVAILVSPIIGTTPTITSTATVTLASDNSTFVRTITTTTAIAPEFVNAVAATTGAVQFQAAGTLDSYYSNKPTPASPLSYTLQNSPSAPGFLGTSAIVLSQDTEISPPPTVALGNAALYGYAVGNQASSISYFSSAYVGGYPKSTTNIDPTRLITNPPPTIGPYPTPYPYALPYQPVFLESSANYIASAVWLPSGCCGISGSTSDNILSVPYALGNPAIPTPTVYKASGINLTSGIVTIQGPVVLIVNGNVNISGGQIQLNTTGSAPASLTIFLETGSMTLGDNGIVNEDAVPLPKRLAILSTSNTSLTNTIQISITSNPFYGVIYFPYLPILVTGTNPTFYGSIVGQSVTFTGSPTIHYDMALRNPDSLASDGAFMSVYSPFAAGNLLQTAGP
jgi:hypothetical protein